MECIVVSTSISGLSWFLLSYLQKLMLQVDIYSFLVNGKLPCVQKFTPTIFLLFAQHHSSSSHNLLPQNTRTIGENKCGVTEPLTKMRPASSLCVVFEFSLLLESRETSHSTISRQTRQRKSTGCPLPTSGTRGKRNCEIRNACV